MNIYHIILKILHRLYVKIFVPQFNAARDIPGILTDADKASSKIYELLSNKKPCMIARYGSTELLNISNYRSITSKKHSAFKYITDKSREWWWNETSCRQILTHSGFFPNTKENIIRFSEQICEDTKALDMLGCWVENEKYMEDLFPKHLTKVPLHLLDPFWSMKPWTKALEGKRVIVIHPFAELIEAQYNDRRTLLFNNLDILPKFQLRTIKAVQSLGGSSNDFADWFEAVEWMKQEIDKEDYDIALIGCGAYGFPLAAHCKRQDKKAVHLGGALQLLFGIRGNRWDDPMYGVKEWGIPEGMYSTLPNEHWIRPGKTGRPRNADQIEGACYW